ncbi:MAG TPA: ABC transporter ATP-binding protein [Nitrospiria bacterium]|nr:ABC transporter ATP-binding protein [Nitrospiria bacterium]
MLFELNKITLAYPKPQGRVMVFKELDLTIDEKEFVAIVGPSGCGKSTLLRMIGGLIAPTHGRVLYNGRPQHGVNPECAMVFQSFALFPWFTVRENVELALEAMGVNGRGRRTRAESYIERVGLGGSEDAYPRELSGGMKQRAGLARALAVEPKVLLMDEPFSALDALTTIALREEVLRIWEDKEFSVKTVIMVTHIIEEAVELADRVVVLSSRPGRIVDDLRIDLPRPRDKRQQPFIEYVDRIFSKLA